MKIQTYMKAGIRPAIMLAAATLVASCDIDSAGENMLGNSDRRAVVDLIFDGITPPGKAQSQMETTVVRLQAAIYNVEGQLEWQETYENAFSVSKTVTGLEVGEKTIVAVANKVVEMPQRLEDFYRIPSTLGENRRGAFVMVGSASAYADVKPAEVVVDLHRIAAKISFRSAILLGWTSTPPEDFAIEAVYVANAGSESDLSGKGTAEPTLNSRSSAELTADEALLDLTYAARTSWKGTGDVFNNGVDFYVYPNTSDVRTTLIIKTRFNGHVSYYPLVIDRDVLSNTQYRCGTVTLTCDGMGTPAEDFSSIKVTYRYAAADWKEESIGDAISF